MSTDRTQEYLTGLVAELRKLPKETEWAEFKQDNDNPEEAGEYISALSNAAALHGRAYGYLLWGVADTTRDVTGTTVDPWSAKKGNEELENWLLRLLSPRIDFRFHEVIVGGLRVVILEIPRAVKHPVQFQGQEYIRIGSQKRKLKEYPEKERELWRVFDRTAFEDGHAAVCLSAGDALALLDYPAYFDLLDMPLPDGADGVLKRLAEDRMIARNEAGSWDITNLGAILFAKEIDKFKGLARKAIRVVLYQGRDRLRTVREQVGHKGYASGFKGLIDFLNAVLPRNEVMGKAIRKEVPMYPEVAIRELLANALIHQDFAPTGTGPMVEVFVDRVEITNPGLPLVDTKRFLDTPPRSRNELLASFMRRVGVCEERGSGVDKVVFQTEYYQLPAPLFETAGDCTRAVLFAHKALRDMDQEDRVRACYLHACLRHVQRDPMTNSSLRERFGIEERNAATASRIIRETVVAGLIRRYEPDQSKKYAKYLPFWA